MSHLGLFLSERDRRSLTRAAEVLHDPFGFGTLDEWRRAVNRALVEVVKSELAIFFVLPCDNGSSKRELIFSDELSSDQKAEFVRIALFDAGSDRALAHGLSVVTQRALVGEDWDEFFADDAVSGFYVPNHIMDSVGLVLWDADGRKEASIEMHRGDFGTPLFGEEGAARLGLLLPAFKAGIAAVRASEATRRGAEALLDAVGQPTALADGRGRITFRSAHLSNLLESDPDQGIVWAALTHIAASQAALFEARGWGRQHRTAMPCLEAALAATATVTTRIGRYLLSAVEAPPDLSSGRHGFLIRVELMSTTATSPVAAQARYGLTAREFQVARLVAGGCSNQWVADALAISSHTARRHTEKVFSKLGVKSRASVGPVMRGESPPPVNSN